jgi:small subunit ribosomal protein S6
MVILDPELEERTVTPSLETYLKIIKDSGGTVDKLDVWGKRRMSFEILKKSEGIYAVVDMHCEPAAIKELDRQLNLNESVLRTKLIVTNSLVLGVAVADVRFIEVILVVIFAPFAGTTDVSPNPSEATATTATFFNEIVFTIFLSFSQIKDDLLSGW